MSARNVLKDRKHEQTLQTKKSYHECIARVQESLCGKRVVREEFEF